MNESTQSHLSRLTIYASCGLIAAATAIGYIFWNKNASILRNDSESNNSEAVIPRECSYLGLVGNTPIIELKKLSSITGCKIFVKMESLNPGGTGKDRAAKSMILHALDTNHMKKETSIVEGTSGSTGIALAGICNALGLKLHVVLPDDQADEKRRLLETYGASVHVVPVCSISNENHYVNRARSLALEINGVFINQFENLANYKVHFEETGPEIYKQMRGRIDAFVMSSGTGGTIAGISRYLKSKNASIKVVLCDPNGSSLHQSVKHKVCYTSQQSERTLKKHRYDSIVEGVGLDRLTLNFREALIDDSEKILDQEIIDMAHWILREEGLFVGSSSAMNIVGACRTAKKLGPGHRIVTLVCDSGQRHLSRFWNKEFVTKYNIVWPDSSNIVPDCLK